MIIDHPAFLRRYRKSHPAVFLVAQWLTWWGWDVRVAPPRESPTFTGRAEYSDRGDIEIVGTDSVIEVKHLSAQFTGAHDWPYRAEIMLDVRDRVVEQLGRVLAFVSVAKDMRTAAVVDADTSEHWYPNGAHNSIKGRFEWNVSAPLWCAAFVPLTPPPYAHPGGQDVPFGGMQEKATRG